MHLAALKIISQLSPYGTLTNAARQNSHFPIALIGSEDTCNYNTGISLSQRQRILHGLNPCKNSLLIYTRGP